MSEAMRELPIGLPIRHNSCARSENPPMTVSKWFKKHYDAELPSIHVNNRQRMRITVHYIDELHVQRCKIFKSEYRDPMTQQTERADPLANSQLQMECKEVRVSVNVEVTVT